MFLGINANYNLNDYNERNVNKKSTDTKSNSVDEYYKKLCDKFPNIKFGVHYFSSNSLFPTSKDWQNTPCVTIDPAYLKKAANDPKVAKDLEEKLSGEPAAIAWLQNASMADGIKVTSVGTYIDGNGDMSSCMSSESTSSKGSTKFRFKTGVFPNIDEILEKQLEKLKEERKEEAKRLAAMDQKDAAKANVTKQACTSYKNNSNTLLKNLNINLVDSNL